jgi:universal stress protein A
VDEARREKADLIVVGSHGRSGMAKLLLGSVAAHVVSHAPCSVLVVRPPA